MSGVTLSYNGFSDFANVDVTNYTSRNDASPTKPGRGSTRHRLEGNALIRVTDLNKSSGGGIETKIAHLQAKLNQNGKALTCTVTDLTGTWDYADVPSGDDKTGPYPEVTIVRIHGTNSLHVTFAFEWFSVDQGTGGQAPSTLLEISIQSEFSIDDIGLTTITKTGYVVMRKSSAEPVALPGVFPTAPAEGSRTAGIGYAATKTNTDISPDYFTPGSFAYPEEVRRLVAGNLLRGFRRVAQKYATDESRTRMVFLVIDKEFQRGLPHPVRSASVDFEFVRAMDGSAGDNGMMGVKTFTATLEGPQWIATAGSAGITPVAVTPSDLLLIAVRMSQNRIRWGPSSGQTQDQIQAVRVREIDMLNTNKIEFSVVARAMEPMGYVDADKQTMPFKHSLWLSNILQTRTVTPSAGTAIDIAFSASFSPDSYGDVGIFRVTPSWYDPQVTPSWTTTSIIAAADKKNAVYILPDSVFTVVFDAATKGVHSGKDKQALTTNSTNNDTPYMSLTYHRRFITPSTGMVVVPSQSLEGADFYGQATKPIALMQEETVMARFNARPERGYGSKPTGGVVVHEDFIENAGKQDANGNRIFGAIYTRVSRVTDPGDTGGNDFLTVGDYRSYSPYQTATGDENKIPEIEIATRGTLPALASQLFPLTLPTPEAYA